MRRLSILIGTGSVLSWTGIAYNAFDACEYDDEGGAFSFFVPSCDDAAFGVGWTNSNRDGFGVSIFCEDGFQILKRHLPENGVSQNRRNHHPRSHLIFLIHWGLIQGVAYHIPSALEKKK